MAPSNRIFSDIFRKIALKACDNFVGLDVSGEE
jgi:hypothetical protein